MLSLYPTTILCFISYHYAMICCTLYYTHNHTISLSLSYYLIIIILLSYYHYIILFALVSKLSTPCAATVPAFWGSEISPFCPVLITFLPWFILVKCDCGLCHDSIPLNPDRSKIGLYMRNRAVFLWRTLVSLRKTIEYTNCINGM